LGKRLADGMEEEQLFFDDVHESANVRAVTCGERDRDA
jgi:hypothetical protein